MWVVGGRVEREGQMREWTGERGNGRVRETEQVSGEEGVIRRRVEHVSDCGWMGSERV